LEFLGSLVSNIMSKRGTKKAKDWKSQHAHLFAKTPKDYRIGRDIQPKRDVSRFVKWPRYVRIQRQRAILSRRLKVPPAIHQFSRTVDKNQAQTLFRLLSAYRPESKQEKKERLLKEAESDVKGNDKKTTKIPPVIKYGLNHVTTLIEQKKAKLVVIAHDVEPIELVIWLPALCRKMDIPYCIVKGKARLGRLVYKKTAAVVCVTEVHKEHVSKLDQLVSNLKVQFNDATDTNKKWGERELGLKSQSVLRQRAKALAREQAKANKM
jgi:large subunit ribosomal protein L7Ae